MKNIFHSLPTLLPSPQWNLIAPRRNISAAWLQVGSIIIFPLKTELKCFDVLFMPAARQMRRCFVHTRILEFRCDLLIVKRFVEMLIWFYFHLANPRTLCERCSNTLFSILIIKWVERNLFDAFFFLPAVCVININFFISSFKSLTRRCARFRSSTLPTRTSFCPFGCRLTRKCPR